MDFSPSESCHRKRSRGEVECDGGFLQSELIMTKIHRPLCSHEASSQESRDVAASSLPTYSDDEDDYPDQNCISETIRSLESELGIQTQEASCSQSDSLYDGRLSTDHPGCNPDFKVSRSIVAKSNRFDRSQSGTFQELGDGVLWMDGIGRSSPRSDVWSENSCSASQIDFSLLCEVLDDQLGLLQNQSCDQLQSFACQEGDSVCSFQSLAADSYGCTILEEDIWGSFSTSPDHRDV